MQMEPVPPRFPVRKWLLLFVPLFVVFFGLVVWLGEDPPAAFVPYQSWVQFAVSAIDLAFGLWFLSCGLFFSTRFAKALGTGPQSALIPGFGPKGTRRFLLFVGLCMLMAGLYSLLHGWR